jgi:hypothetical protein
MELAPTPRPCHHRLAELGSPHFGFKAIPLLQRNPAPSGPLDWPVLNELGFRQEVKVLLDFN